MKKTTEIMCPNCTSAKLITDTSETDLICPYCGTYFNKVSTNTVRYK